MKTIMCIIMLLVSVGIVVSMGLSLVHPTPIPADTTLTEVLDKALHDLREILYILGGLFVASVLLLIIQFVVGYYRVVKEEKGEKGQ